METVRFEECRSNVNSFFTHYKNNWDTRLLPGQNDLEMKVAVLNHPLMCCEDWKSSFTRLKKKKKVLFYDIGTFDDEKYVHDVT